MVSLVEAAAENDWCADKRIPMHYSLCIEAFTFSLSPSQRWKNKSSDQDLSCSLCAHFTISDPKEIFSNQPTILLPTRVLVTVWKRLTYQIISFRHNMDHVLGYIFSCALLVCNIVQFLLISRIYVFSISALPISHGSRLWAPYRAGNCQSTSWTNWKKHCLGFVWISNIFLEEKINSQILYLIIR